MTFSYIALVINKLYSFFCSILFHTNDTTRTMWVYYLLLHTIVLNKSQAPHVNSQSINSIWKIQRKRVGHIEFRYDLPFQIYCKIMGLSVI